MEKRGDTNKDKDGESAGGEMRSHGSGFTSRRALCVAVTQRCDCSLADKWSY